MDFSLPQDLLAYLDELDAFIAAEIKPLEEQDDNIRFFDHRREHARTDWDNQGLPRHDWEQLLRAATRKADAAGHWRFSAPKAYGGKDGSNLWMAVIRDRFAQKGLGLHNDLQNEHTQPHDRELRPRIGEPVTANLEPKRDNTDERRHRVQRHPPRPQPERQQQRA